MTPTPSQFRLLDLLTRWQFSGPWKRLSAAQQEYCRQWQFAAETPDLRRLDPENEWLQYTGRLAEDYLAMFQADLLRTGAEVGEIRELLAELYPRLLPLFGPPLRVGFPVDPNEWASRIGMILVQVLAADQQAWATQTATAPSDQEQAPARRRMSHDEAEAKARELAAADPDFAKRPGREWATRIGCSEAQVNKLPLWNESRHLRARRRRGSAGDCLDHSVALGEHDPRGRSSYSDVLEEIGDREERMANGEPVDDYQDEEERQKALRELIRDQERDTADDRRRKRPRTRV